MLCDLFELCICNDRCRVLVWVYFHSGICMLLAMHVLLVLLELTMMVVGFCFV